MKNTAGARRRSPTLGLRSASLLRLIIRASQRTPLGPSITPQTFELLGGGERLASGRREYDDGPAFFAHFDGSLGPDDLANLRILDLGCGYGGRTVYYAKECRADHVDGVDIIPEVVRRCERLADALSCANASFHVAFAEDLPFTDGQFDAVVSYDVLEHVVDPFRSLAEVARVLRPGGRAWLVFPSYLGARSSHLDYLTRVPGLHRIFDPEVIVSVVNEFLREDPTRFGTRPQPRPSISSLGRLTLPTLNGLTLSDAHQAVRVAGLSLAHVSLTPIIHERLPLPGARQAGSALRYWSRRFSLPELLVGNIAFTAVKPIAASQAADNGSAGGVAGT